MSASLAADVLCEVFVPVWRVRSVAKAIQRARFPGTIILRSAPALRRRSYSGEQRVAVQAVALGALQLSFPQWQGANL